MAYIGVDISKNFFDCAYREDNQYRHARFDNNDNGFKNALAWAPQNGHWVMEATGPYYQRLAWYLDQCAGAVSVINPLVIKRFAQMRLHGVKTDPQDAILIADYGHLCQPGCWHIPSDAQSTLMQLQHWLDGLIRERTQLKNRMEALSQAPLINAFVNKKQRALLSSLNKQIAAAEKELDRCLKRYYPLLYERLQTIPGIARKTAGALIIVTDGFTRFDNAKQLVAYAGLAARVDQSGNRSWGSTAIVKRGNSHLRQLLYICSWTAQRCNPACKALADRLRAKGKPERKVKIAIAAKLLRQAFGVAMSGQSFNENIALGA